VHFNASVALEWWCATSVAAEKKVSSKHSNAIFFEIDCITAAPTTRVFKTYTGNVTETILAINRMRLITAPKVGSLK